MVNPEKKLKKILFILGITGAVYAGFRYLLPLVVPFLLAYGTALWLRPSVRYIRRNIQWQFRGKKRQLSGMLIGAAEIAAILSVIAGIVSFAGSRLRSQMKSFVEAIPDWLIREFAEILRQFSMPAIVNNSVSILRMSIELIVVFVIFMIATLMFLQEMEEIREKKSNSMFHREFAIIGRRLVLVGSAWLKSELVIVSVTATLCTFVLFLIENDYALLLGIGIGLVDALPFLGAGVILLPWGMILLIQKQWLQGTLLLGVYVVCYFLRQVLETKIMGNRMGLTQIETLASMYVGVKLFGISGFLLGPIGLLMIEDLVDLYWKESD